MNIIYSYYEDIRGISGFGKLSTKREILCSVGGPLSDMMGLPGLPVCEP